jgi:glycosyltransferase involved in cell wall biosynthesis
METGPLVVYEAFAAGIPVIGSRLGGIAELVTHEKNGLLVEPASPKAWADALRRIADSPDLLGRLRGGIGSVRNMSQVATEMEAIYGSLVSQRQAASQAVANIL